MHEHMVTFSIAYVLYYAVLKVRYHTICTVLTAKLIAGGVQWHRSVVVCCCVQVLAR